MPLFVPPYPVVAKVWKTEEKGSDVNLASHLVYDACQGSFDVAAVLSNDTDLVEPIRIVTQELGLPVIDVGQMQSATHERHPCNIYPVQIASPIVTFNSPRTMGANLAVQGLLALIGRDVLAVCNLFYNGPSGQFTLSL